MAEKTYGRKKHITKKILLHKKTYDRKKHMAEKTYGRKNIGLH